MYRYLLQQNNRDLCPLADELLFIRAYFHLLKTRYGDGLCIEMAVEDRLAYLLPNGIGLQNIMMKYSLLDHSEIIVDDDGARFRVGLPLMAPVAGAKGNA